MLTVIDGLKGLQVVGADVVEVAPIYDNPGETTVLAAAEIVHSLLTLMVQQPIDSLFVVHKSKDSGIMAQQ